jgi:hypothetical protein
MPCSTLKEKLLIGILHKVSVYALLSEILLSESVDLLLGGHVYMSTKLLGRHQITHTYGYNNCLGLNL